VNLNGRRRRVAGFPAGIAAQNIFREGEYDISWKNLETLDYGEGVRLS
jgi:hypothetical protein